MNNFEQFIADLQAHEDIRQRLRAKINKLRANYSINVFKAIQDAASELGYEISDKEAGDFVAHVNSRNKRKAKQKLSEEELNEVIGGCTYGYVSFNCYCSVK